MENNLITVTVTGADDSIEPRQLINLQERYPYAEFAILLGNEYAGRDRFPSKNWLEGLVALTDVFDLRLSGHLCGQAVKDFTQGRLIVPEGLQSLDIFQRLQLNTHGVWHNWSPAMMDLISHLNGSNSTQVIFQYDKVNSEVLSAAWDAGLDVAALYDLSHGAGVVPEKWERPTGPDGASLDGLLCGYAGGLSPENVASHLEKITLTAGNSPFWIDAETHLRSRQNGRDIFDLERVTHFLEAARPWLKKEQSCRVCGCTDLDCSGCIERTGVPCHWVEKDLCSACA